MRKDAFRFARCSKDSGFDIHNGFPVTADLTSARGPMRRQRLFSPDMFPFLHGIFPSNSTEAGQLAILARLLRRASSKSGHPSSNRCVFTSKQSKVILNRNEGSIYVDPTPVKMRSPAPGALSPACKSQVPLNQNARDILRGFTPTRCQKPPLIKSAMASERRAPHF